jgi:hypothetical protein
MTFTANRPLLGLSNGREVSLCSVAHAAGLRYTSYSRDYTRSVTFAAMAGVTRKVLCNRTGL